MPFLGVMLFLDKDDLSQSKPYNYFFSFDKILLLLNLRQGNNSFLALACRLCTENFIMRGPISLDLHCWKLQTCKMYGKVQYLTPIQSHVPLEVNDVTCDSKDLFTLWITFSFYGSYQFSTRYVNYHCTWKYYHFCVASWCPFFSVSAIV